MTGFIFAVDKAFCMDGPASTHEGGVIPLGTILGVLSGKILPPGLVFLQQKLGDGGWVLCKAFSIILVILAWFSLLVLSFLLD